MTARKKQNGFNRAGLRVLMGKITGFLEIERHDRKYTRLPSA